MALFLRAIPKTIRAASSQQWINSAVAGLSTSTVRLAEDISKATTHKEAPIIDNDVTVSPNEHMAKEKLSSLIQIPVEKNLSSISGVPSEFVKTRRVRIYIPSKNAMQSGTDNIQNWEMEFDTRERWENPLMGWASSGDPLSNIKLQFNSKEEAIQHCETNGWRWFIDGEEKPYVKRNKNYGINFSWNKRTRVSTK